jgi:hypothetical protein
MKKINWQSAAKIRADFAAFATQQRIAGSKYFRSNCKSCHQAIRVSLDALRKEWLWVEHPQCDACRWPNMYVRPYGVSPQELHDIVYHGSRFHAGEW